MNLLSVRNLRLAYGDNVLFDGLDFGIDEGETTALVGANGAGKSSLLNILAGRILPDDGEVAFREGVTVGYLPQQVEFEPGETPRELVARAVADRREAIEAHGELTRRLGEEGESGDISELLTRQAELQQTIERLGGWNWEHQVEEMIARLGIEDLLDTPVGRLSGGQKRRVDLARVLLETHDLLLLDEPTNHLDTASVEWLESWLRGRTRTLLFVTHDRYFLERVAGRILELDDRGELYDHPGNYSTYMERKLHRLDIRERTERRRKKLLEKELAWLKGGIKASNTRSKKRVKQIQDLKSEGPIHRPEERMEMDLAEGTMLGDTILEGFGLVKSKGGKELLSGANIALARGDKIGIVGPNGCGKSTLLRMLMGEEPIDAGVVNKGSKTEIAWLRQEGGIVDDSMTVYDAFSVSDYVWVGDTKYHKKNYLERFIFDRKMQRSKLSTLSGGQQRRFGLARLVAENANVLILDEPTNDLDLMSLQTLEEALEEFTGCVVAVSHDRYFLNRVCNSIVAFEDKKLVRYEGNYDDYRRRIASREEHAATEEARFVARAPSQSKSNEPKERSGLTYAERLHADELEAELGRLEDARDDLEEALADPELYSERSDEIAALNKKLKTLKRRIDTVFDEWAELEARRSEG